MPPRRVAESAPVQVYLGTEDRLRLDHLTEQLEASKSDILRRGLLALERELLSPATHPALRLIGIAQSKTRGVPSDDAARDHDRLLADTEETSWVPPRPPRAKRRAR